jgi:uncharacterized membrane protein YgaE (UPF0421/DUF939 family)
MTSAAKRALDTLKKIHRFENEMLHLPENFQQSIQEQLDSVIYHHEQLMLRFIGKVPTPLDSDTNTCINKKELFELFLNHQMLYSNQDDPHLYHTMQIISSIIDYGEQVEHLDTLITSFHSFHHNEVSIEQKEIE